MSETTSSNHDCRKFLFIIPPYFNTEDFKDGMGNFLPAFTIPYGVLSLISYLESKLKNKIMFEIIDLNITLKNCIENNQDYNKTSKDEIEAIFKETKYDIVGISALFNSAFKYIDDISTQIKKISKSIYVICGGGLPSAGYTYVLQYCKNIDAICKGEGELPLERVLKAKNISTACETDESFATRNSLKSKIIPKANYLSNLDIIPPLQYKRLNLDNYNSRSIDKRFNSSVQKRELSIHTSRGCPFKCVFCSNPSLHGFRVRFMSIEKVESEILRMKNEYGMTVLMVEDDHFFHNIKRAKEILKIMAKHHIRAEFPNGMAVYAIDDEVAKLLHSAGVSAAALAVESGSDYVLSKLMRKPLKTKQIKPAVEALRNNDIRAHMFIVAGIPGENDAHREETRNMLLSSNLDWVHIYCAIPIFGSKLFDICKENNYIDLSDDPAKFVATKSIIKTPEIDPKALQRWVYKTQIEVNFVFNANIRLNNYERALPYFENVVQKYPTHAFGNFIRGTIYKQIGKHEQAERDFENARRDFKNSDWINLALEIGAPIMNPLSKYNII